MSQKKRVPLQQKQDNQNNHALIYSIGEYRKSVTNLAIGCIRKQSVRLAQKQDVQKAVIQNINSQNNCTYISKPMDQNKFKSKQIQGSVSTKKKRYNYGVTLEPQNSSQQKKFNPIKISYKSTSKCDDNQKSLTKYNYERLTTKSYSLLNRRENNYLTQPFNVGQNQYNYSAQLRRQSQHDRKNNQITDIRKGQNTQNNGILDREKVQEKLKKIQQKLTAFQSIRINKQNITINKPNKNQKSFLRNKQTLSKINKPQHRTVNYPKTQTYTSRSDYNIEKLTHKLDSYIKKHIRNS